MFEKILTLISTEPELDLASLASAQTLTLVLQGDRDEVTGDADPLADLRVSMAKLKSPLVATKSPHLSV